MGLLTDAFSAVPKEIKLILGISIFLYAGTTLINIIIWLYNTLVVNAINLANGCLGGDVAVCMPQLAGVFIFGINFADYWVITALIFFPMVIIFAIRWYAMMLPKVSG